MSYSYAIEVKTATEDATWHPGYIGTTGLEDVGRGVKERYEGEHVHLTGGAPRVAASLARHGAAVHRVRILDKIEDVDGRPLETYLMKKFDTVVPKYSKLKDRFAYANREYDFRMPDISLPGQPRSFRLNCKRSCRDQPAIDAAGAAYETRQATTTLAIYDEEEMHRVYDRIEAQLDLDRYLDAPLQRVMVACAKEDADDDEFERIQFTIDSPYMRANQLRLEYEACNSWDEIPGEELFRAVKSVRDFVCPEGDVAAPASRKALDSQLRALYLVVHPDKSAGMPAGGVAGIFKTIEVLAGKVEEAELRERAKNEPELKERVDEADYWHEWIKANEGVKPVDNPTSKSKSLDDKTREKQVAASMSGWRKGKYDNPKQRDRNVYLVILRAFPIFAEFCIGTNQKSRDKAKVVNALLKQGYGVTKEKNVHPELKIFPSICPTCFRNTSEFTMWQNYLAGQNDKHESTLLAGLPAWRISIAKGIHDAAVPDTKVRQVEAGRKGKEAAHASGLRKPNARTTKRTRDDE